MPRHPRLGDGPPVTPPTRHGFGSQLLQRALGAQIGASVKIDYVPLGLQVEVQLPLKDCIKISQNRAAVTSSNECLTMLIVALNSPAPWPFILQSYLRLCEVIMSKDARLAIARNLVRIYADVLKEPLPPVLTELLNRLEACESARL